MTMRLISAAALLCCLSGCADLEGYSTGVSTVQFDDVPVPDGMQYLPGQLRSHSLDVAGFRSAHFEYFGATPVADVAAYLRQRMPLEGWALTATPVDQPGRIVMEFVRRPYRCRCLIHRDESYSTRLTVDYTTEHAK